MNGPTGGLVAGGFAQVGAGGCQTATQPSNGLTSTFEQLNNQIQHLEEQVNILSERLRPIRRIGPVCSSGLNEKQQSQSPLVEALSVTRNRISSANAVLRMILDEIEM